MKKILQTCLASALLLNSALPVAQASFTDVPNAHWANQYVSIASDAQLVQGVGSNQFLPDKEMTYGEFAVVIVNGAYQGKFANTGTTVHWADPYLNVLINNNLFYDSNRSNVAPTNQAKWQDIPITREDAATVVARLMEQGPFAIGETKQATDFADISYSTLSSGQIQDVANVVANGVMSGTGTSFGVGSSLTRAQASVIISKMLESTLLKKKDGSIYQSNQNNTTNTPSTTTPSTTVTDPSVKQAEYVAEVFRLVNVERAKEGLAPYQWNDALMEAAQFKSDEMAKLNYFDHSSPIYGGFTGIIKLYLTNYGAAAENIAKGQNTPASVVSAWMNSSGHKANILSSSRTQIGIGYNASGNYWTQQFTSSAGTPVNGNSSTPSTGTTTTPNTGTTTTPSTGTTTTPNTGTTTTPSTGTTTTPSTGTTTTPNTGTTTTPSTGTTTTPSTPLSGWNANLEDGTYRFAYYLPSAGAGSNMWQLNGYIMLEKTYTDDYILNTVIADKKMYTNGHTTSSQTGKITLHSAQYALTIDSYEPNSKLVVYQGKTRIEFQRTGNNEWSIVSIHESFSPYYLTYPDAYGKQDILSIPTSVLSQSTISSADSLRDSDYPFVTLEITIKDGIVTKAVAANSPYGTETGSTGSTTTPNTGTTTTPSTGTTTTPSTGTTTTPSTGTTTTPSTGTTTTPSTGTTTTPSTGTTTTPSTDSYVQEVFDLVNEERAKVGLKALIWHDDLMDSAQFKSEEMNKLDYFSHESPVYGDFTGIMRLFIDFNTINDYGENCAMGQRTPESAMTSWMNSSGHKANILSSSYTHIGIGFDGYYWTQQFIRVR